MPLPHPPGDYCRAFSLRSPHFRFSSAAGRIFAICRADGFSDLIFLVDRKGLEPLTSRMRTERSPAELTAHFVVSFFMAGLE